MCLVISTQSILRWSSRNSNHCQAMSNHCQHFDIFSERSGCDDGDSTHSSSYVGQRRNRWQKHKSPASAPACLQDLAPSEIDLASFRSLQVTMEANSSSFCSVASFDQFVIDGVSVATQTDQFMIDAVSVAAQTELMPPATPPVGPPPQRAPPQAQEDVVIIQCPVPLYFMDQPNPQICYRCGTWSNGEVQGMIHEASPKCQQRRRAGKRYVQLQM